MSQSDTQHIAADAQWRRTFKDELGQVYTPFVFVRGDIYNISSFTRDAFPNRAVRLAATSAGIGLDYRYPLVASTAASRTLLSR